MHVVWGFDIAALRYVRRVTIGIRLPKILGDMGDTLLDVQRRTPRCRMRRRRILGLGTGLTPNARNPGGHHACYRHLARRVLAKSLVCDLDDLIKRRLRFGGETRVAAQLGRDYGEWLRC